VQLKMTDGRSPGTKVGGLDKSLSKSSVGWSAGGMEARSPAPVFVAPNEKRRDRVRWEVRQRMANPATF